ncbi:MAG TPA: hypothetical protein VK488_13730 [Gaiellaceae bacterium]|nr:hypothetical protein [Gaiellaceae bacterium]
MSRITWITLSAAVVALAAVAAAAALLAGGGGGSEPTTTASDTTPLSSTQSFSLPLAEEPSTLALAKHSGALLVGLAARPGGPVEVAVLRGQDPVAANEFQVQIDGKTVEARTCGQGCSRIEAAVLGGSPKRLTVRAGSVTLAFELPARLPPTGAGVFGRAQETMGSLQSFRFHERLTSGAGGVSTDYEVQAPNRLRLHTTGGYRAVYIGRAQWDYQGGRWERAPFPGLTLKQMLVWYQAKHARIVGRRANGVTELAAFGLEPVPAFFRLEVEPTGRVVEADMIAASHFMVHRYSDYNGRFTIRPPQQ